ncbi:hypothetical protein HAX54_007503 [Datura stramonium]|uniref:Uncharacterized protein n=1 Tax=Datura stramonium TaxID=4076 RepID=A0ABS8TDR3_DATST|nr:hypothetical protein [Datura stramonium]
MVSLVVCSSEKTKKRKRGEGATVVVFWLLYRNSEKRVREREIRRFTGWRWERADGRYLVVGKKWGRCSCFLVVPALAGCSLKNGEERRFSSVVCFVGSMAMMVVFRRREGERGWRLVHRSSGGRFSGGRWQRGGG